MHRTSEWVSLGHPDKVADFISCYLLDRYLERDPLTRFAVEVQIKGPWVTLGGEVTSVANFSEEDITAFVKAAVAQIGYTPSYQKLWGKENTISSDDLIVTSHISAQSPDIAQGVNASGWGDQGLFHGMAVNDHSTKYMPKDWWLAKQIGQRLYDLRLGGVDIKTQVTMNDDKIEEVVVAIPMGKRNYDYDVENAVRFCCGEKDNFPVIINGTGRFVKHGPIADCGTTGRKLAVDFYGGNCKIGGGSPWTKDGTKADLSLNLLARHKALNYVKAHPECPEAYCSISCRIGAPDILVVLTDRQGNELLSRHEIMPPETVIEFLQLRTPRFAKMCQNGLFA